MTYTNIDGRSRANAEALLAAAKKLNLPVNVVRTTIRGYIVPDAVAAEYRKMLAGETKPIEEEPVKSEPVETVPDSTWKNADIEAYAEEHGIDLGGATKKADMIAAITADTKEE